MKKNILYSGLAALLLSFTASCESSDNEFPDFDYQTVYFANQLAMRTIELGEDEFVDNTGDNEHRFSINAAWGGGYTNRQNVIIDYVVDPSLCDRLYFKGTDTPLTLMPESYYELGNPSQIAIPRGEIKGGVDVYLTDAFILAGLAFLLLRRVCTEKLRYISLPADYFALFLLIAIAGSGICMRYISKVDINQVKEVIMGLATLQPVDPSGIGSMFFIHVTLVSALLIYFPFSKLMHMGGVFMSPTRNMKCNTREERHVNPWNPPKSYHTYAEYEDDFRDAMVEAGIPVEKQPEPKTEA